MPIHEKPSTLVKTAFPVFHTTPETPFTWEPSKLNVIVPVTNSCRYSSRYHLFEKFEKMVIDAGAQLWVVEAAFRHRPHAVTHHENPRNIQLRTSSEIWHKENLINIGISRLPSDWEYVAWIDSDITFARPDWVNETLNQLQHYHVVQMFSNTHDLAPDFSIIRNHTGFMARYKSGGFDDLPGAAPGNMTMTSYFGGSRQIPPKPRPYYAHPGYAWAARREAIDHLGGLLDFAILGSADYYMAYGLIGKIQQTMNPLWTDGFKNMMIEWGARADRHIRKNVGFVSGSILHQWHGKKKDRRYNDRNKILVENQYDPHLDLKKDSHGVWQLTGRSIPLRDQIREYFRGRAEDSIDVI